MKSLLCACLMLLVASAAFAQDVCAPAKVTTLATATYHSSIRITWTATGDDCSTGDATTYEVRFSTSTITDTNWQSASVLVTGSSVTNGNQDCAVKDVFSPCATTTFYFAVFLIDEAGNRSPLSNVPTGAARCTGSMQVAEC